MTAKSRSWAVTFFIIWTGQAFSLLGSSAAQFAIIWWLTIQTGSATVLAMAGLAGFLPQALVGPFAGVWVDRLSRKRVMIAADLFIAAASGALAASVPPESLGRVFSLMGAVMSLATPVGLFVAGPVAEAAGVPNWFLASGVGILLVGVGTYWRSRALLAGAPQAARQALPS